jgi:hypothetical protein
MAETMDMHRRHVLSVVGAIGSLSSSLSVSVVIIETQDLEKPNSNWPPPDSTDSSAQIASQSWSSTPD